jgi:hypothetical protein
MPRRLIQDTRVEAVPKNQSTVEVAEMLSSFRKWTGAGGLFLGRA